MAKKITEFTTAGSVPAGSFFLFEDSAGNYFSVGVADMTGSGDMTQAVYDPTAVSGDAFSMLNMVGGGFTHSATETRLATSDLVLNERADHAGTPAAGEGRLWVRNDTPSVLVFTDDTGVDNVLGVGSVTADSTTTFTNKTVDDFSNTVHANNIHAKVRNESGGLLTTGTPVYVTGYNVGNDAITVDAADADDPAKMPSIGLLEEDLANNANGDIAVSGEVNGWDTSSWTAGDALYVDTTAGQLTNVRPTSKTAAVQKVAVVTRSHASLGRVYVIGAGRTNAIPNTMTDERFMVVDDGDATKRLEIEMSGSTTGVDTTLAVSSTAARTITLPDATTTLVGGSGSNNRIATFSGTNTLDSSSFFTFDSSVAKAEISTSAGAAADLLSLKNTNTGGFGANLSFSVYDTDNLTQFELAEVRSVFVAGGSGGYLDFRVKGDSNDAQLSSIAAGYDRVGMGTTSPDSRLHLWDGNAGAISSVNHTLLTIEKGNNAYINFLTPNTSSSGMFFGDPEDADEAGIVYFHSGTPGMYFRTGGNLNRMFIQEDGDVGIGTTSPDTILHVQNASAGVVDATASSVIVAESNGDAVCGFLTGNNNWGGITVGNATDANNQASLLYSPPLGSGQWQFRAGGNSTKMVIEDGGNVGIGATSPMAKFHVEQGDSGLASVDAETVAVFENTTHTQVNIVSGNTSTAALWFGDSDSGKRGYLDYDHVANDLTIGVAGSPMVTVKATGRVGIGTTSPDSPLDIAGGNFRLGGDIVFEERADHASTPAAGFGYLWTKNTVPSTLIFTDDAGTDFTINGAGGGNVSNTGTPLNNQLAVWTDATTVEGDANLAWSGTQLSVTGDIDLTTGSVFLDAGEYVGQNTFISLLFDAAQGPVLNSTANVRVNIDSDNSDADTRYFEVAKNVNTATGGTSLFYIGEDGDVGIGTTSPDEKLDISTGNFRLGGDIVFEERADHAATPTAGLGQLWVRSDTPNVLVFTDDAGTDTVLGAGGGDVTKVGTPVDNQIGVWTGDGTIEGDASLTFDSASQIMQIGDNDTDHGIIQLMGNATASAQGGELRLYYAADYDAASNEYAFVTSNENDLALGHQTQGTFLTVTHEGRVSAYVALDTYNGASVNILGGDTSSDGLRTDATAKTTRLGAPSYTNAEEPMGLIHASTSNTTNQLNIGGGTSSLNTATHISLFTGAINTTTGTERIRINSAGDVALFAGAADERLDLGTENMRLGGDIIFEERADHAATPAAGLGQLWVKSDTPSSLIFTDDAGTDYDLTAAAGGGDVTKVGTPVDNQIGVWTGDGTIEGDTELTFDTATNTFAVETTGFVYDGSTNHVGINTSSPGYRLDVRQGTNPKIAIGTSDSTIISGNSLGELVFYAPLEASGGDAILPGACIEAEAQATFSSTDNSTDLVFKTAQSESATEKMRLSEEGYLAIGAAAGSPTQAITLRDSGANIYFAGSSGGADEGILYKDSGGTQRSALRIEATNVVAICNRASNGSVELRANSSTAGAGGETTVATVNDTDVTFAEHVIRAVTSGITASVTQTQGQGPLTEDINEVSTVANASDTVTLPTAVAGMKVTVINNGANTLQIFPASGDDLGAGLNTATTIATTEFAEFTAYDATNWTGVKLTKI